MKLSIFCPFGLKTPIHAPKIGVLGVLHPQAISAKHPKGTSVGRNGFRGVLVMSVSSVVHEKSHGNKQCDEEELKEEQQHIFGHFGITVKWP